MPATVLGDPASRGENERFFLRHKFITMRHGTVTRPTKQSWVAAPP